MPLLFQLKLTKMPAAGGFLGCLGPQRLEMGVPPLEQPLVAAPPREGEIEEPGDGPSSPSASTTMLLSSCNSCEWGGGGGL